MRSSLSLRLPEDRQRLSFALLCATLALEAVGVGMLFPLLARIQEAHHFQTYGLGLMSGGYFLAALVAQAGGGRLLDGRRARPVLFAGLALGSASLVWFALAGGLWGLVGSRAVGGVSFGIVGPAALRAGTVGYDSERQGARLGTLSSAQMAGIVLGPLAGSVLASLGGLAFPFLVLAATVGLALGALVVVLPAAPEQEAPTRAAPATATTPSSRWRPAPSALAALLCLAIGAQLATGLYDSLWSRLLTDRGADSLLIGLSLTLFGVPFVALAPAGGRLAGRRGPLRVAAVGLLVASLFLASYGFVTVPLIILVLGVFEAFAQALAVPGGYAAVASVFPDDQAATGQGWFGAAGTAAAGVAALVGAPLYAAIGPGAVFAGGAAVSAGFVIAALVLGRGRIGRPDGQAEATAGRAVPGTPLPSPSSPGSPWPGTPLPGGAPAPGAALPGRPLPGQPLPGRSGSLAAET